MELKVGLICKGLLVKCKFTGKDRAAACLLRGCGLHSTKLGISIHSSSKELVAKVKVYTYL